MNRYLTQAVKHYEDNIRIFDENRLKYKTLISNLNSIGIDGKLITRSFNEEMKNDGITYHTETCPLCNRYLHNRIFKCLGCPVGKGGHKFCEDTPWEDIVYYIFNALDLDRINLYLDLVGKGFVKELEFLKELDTGKIKSKE